MGNCFQRSKYSQLLSFKYIYCLHTRKRRRYKRENNYTNFLLKGFKVSNLSQRENKVKLQEVHTERKIHIMRSSNNEKLSL